MKYIPVFKNESKQIVKKIKEFIPQEIKSMMSISTDLAELNVQRFNRWKFSNVYSEYRVQAITAFSGEVYKAFNVNSLKESEILKANDTIRIISGLYGILKPFDYIYPYRLEMGTSFSPIENQKNLYEFWSDKIRKQLQKEMKKDEVLINLSSNEYAKAAQLKRIKNKVITPVFKEIKGEKHTVVMMYAKHARGSMARYIIENQIEDAEWLKNYSVDGYSFDDKISNENEWVFVR